MQLPLIKYLFLLFTGLCGNSLSAQFLDSFGDGDLSKNPTWLGDSGKFEVDAMQMLHLKALPQTGKAQLATTSKAMINAEWSFRVKLGFNPSSSNLAKIYLASNNNNLLNPLNGYYVKIGGTEDEISLYLQNGSASEKLVDGRDKILNRDSVAVMIKVTLDQQGNWSLYCDTLGTGDFYLEGTSNNQAFMFCQWFGVVCEYTQTRAEKFWFDDFKVTGEPGSGIPTPLLQKPFLFYKNSTLQIAFNQPVNLDSLWQAEPLPDDLVITQGADLSKINLTFSAIPSLTYVFHHPGVRGYENNTLLETRVSFRQPEPAPGRVVLNELLYDPKGSESDFVELYNYSDDFVSLYNTNLAQGDPALGPKLYAIDTSGLLMPPLTFLVLTGDTASVKRQYPYCNPGALMEMQNFPAFPNANGVAILSDQAGNIIEQLDYNDNMHLEALTSTEGITLERISPFVPCINKDNWTSSASVSGFGTPGYKNSQYLTQATSSGVTLSSDVISPNNDGTDDVLVITLASLSSRYSGSVYILDIEGRPVKTLLKNSSLANETTTFWKGDLEGGGMAVPGLYIVMCELYNDSGDNRRYKAAFVLSL